MGCDGGTIPKRKEVVKNKNRRATRNKEVDESEKWRTCALSDWVLRKPIVATHYGYLFSKEEALKFLLEWREDRLSAHHQKEDKGDILNPVHSTKDIKDLKLKPNPNLDNEQALHIGENSFAAEYVCPITGLETNGKYKFMFSWKCGCVVSERAIKEVPNDDKCLVCQKPYKEFHLVTINPDEEELKLNQAKFMARKLEEIMKKGETDPSCSSKESKSSNKSRKSSSSVSSADPGPSTSVGPSRYSSSRKTTSKSSGDKREGSESRYKSDKRSKRDT